jgi:CheY-like chemotaxis protein
MPLILAVEPDPRQASRLSAVLRGRRNTAVVMAKSAETALASMKGRVPDVLLTSQLLSPQDEQRLADWLKELGPTAQHVQALTIPILATPDKAAAEPPRGLLAGLRRRAQTPGSHGCEPKVFAEHVATYLEQRHVERTEDVVAAEPTAMPEEPALRAEADIPPVVVASAAYTTEAIDEEQEEGAWLLTQNREAATHEPTAQDPDGAVPPTPVYELPAEVVSMEPMEVVFLPPEVVTVWDEDGWGASRYVDRQEFDTAVIPPPAPSNLPAPHAAAFASAPMAVVEASTAPPVMDEWGLFDPAKCGFSALLDKLDEITEAERRAQNCDSSVRIVTHY